MSLSKLSNLTRILIPKCITVTKPQLQRTQLYATRNALNRSLNITNQNQNKILKSTLLIKKSPTTTNAAPPPPPPLQQQQIEQKLTLFARFKDAYRKHGKVLIVVHLTSCVGWFCGFYLLSKSGFDITRLFNIFERLHIMSHETSQSIETKINNFNLETFLRSYHFNAVLNDSQLEWCGHAVTGITLKHILTAVMIYKIVTPLRYLFTITFTKVFIDLLKRRGVIPTRPPPGSSMKELYEEQKLVLRRSIKAKREQFKFKNSTLTSSRLLFKRPINLKSSFNPMRKKTPK